MFEVSVKTHFSAAHRLVGYQGHCANLHGHNWDVEVFVRGENLDDIGMLVDFSDIKKAVGELMDVLDHSDLNAIPAFTEQNPTSENIAKYLYQELAVRLATDDCAIHCVTVCESAKTSVSYREGTN